MVYAEGQLSGSADFRVGINIWRSSTTNDGNYSTFGYEVHLTTPHQYGTWDGDSTQSWSANIGGNIRSGTFKLTYENRYNNNVIVGSGYVGIAHNADGTRPGFASTASISTNHSSVGSGTSPQAWIDAPRIPKRPSAPGSPAVSSYTHNSVTLSWKASADNGGSNVVQYLVRLNTKTPAESSGYTDKFVTGTSATFTGLNPGTKYYLIVYAQNNASWDNNGYSAKSSEVSVTTHTVPSTPSTPSVTTVSQSSIKATWSAPSNGGSAITGYDVQRATNSAFTSGVATSSSTTTSLTFTGLSAGTKYYVRVRAKNAAGTGGWSSGASTTTWSVPNTPATPTISNVSANSLRVNFTAPGSNGTPILEYQTQLSSSSTYSTAVQTKSGTSPVTFSGLSNHTTYYVRVRARNLVGWGPYSASRSDATLGHPTAPRSITATASTSVTGRVAVSWTAPSTVGEGGIVGYNIFRDGTQVATTTGTGTSWTDNGRTPFTTYSYNVAARNAYSTSVSGVGPQGTANTVVAQGPPTPPRNLTGSVDTVNAGRITLSWTVPATTGAGGITGYNIELTNGTPIAVTTGTSTTYVVNNLTPNTTYSFRVAARNALADTQGAKSGFSNTVTLTSEGEPGAPGVLTVSPSLTTSNRLQLSWGVATGDVVGYNIFRRVGSTDTKIGSIGPQHTEFTVDDLVAGQTYSYVVRARSTYTDTLPNNAYPGNWGGPATAVKSATASVNSTQTASNVSSLTNKTASAYNGSFTISSVDATRIRYVKSSENYAANTAIGSVTNTSNSRYNGTYTISTPNATTITYSKSGSTVTAYSASGSVSNATNADLSGTHTVTAVNAGAFQLSYAKSGGDFAVRAVPINPPPGASSALINRSNTVYNGTGLVITSITEDSFTYSKTNANLPEVDAAGTVTNTTNMNTFNGVYTITSIASHDTFSYQKTASNVSPVRQWFITEDGYVQRTVSPSSVSIKFRSGWAG